MEDYKDVKKLKMVSLKEYHDQAEKIEKKNSESKKNMMKRFKIRTDSSLIVKTEGS